MKKLKKEFIAKLKSISIPDDEPDTYDLLWGVIDELPNCFAKGYLEALFQADSDENGLKGLKSRMLDCAKTKIWK